MCGISRIYSTKGLRSIFIKVGFAFLKTDFLHGTNQVAVNHFNLLSPRFRPI